MAADTALKRYSAMNMTSPWRGLNVTPDNTIPQGERQATMFMYSGIAATAATFSGNPSDFKITVGIPTLGSGGGTIGMGLG